MEWGIDEELPWCQGGQKIRKIEGDFLQTIAVVGQAGHVAPLAPTLAVVPVLLRAAIVRNAYKVYQLDSHLMVRHPDTPHDFVRTMREEAYTMIESVLGKP